MQRGDKYAAIATLICTTMVIASIPVMAHGWIITASVLICAGGGGMLGGLAYLIMRNLPV